MQAQVEPLNAFADEVRAYFDRVVLLGMGGSSLAPEVLWRTLGQQKGFPSFGMLDSTHPDAVAAIADRGAFKGTLFIAASKSGTTLETRCLLEHFWRECGGRGEQFVAITDPGSPLAKLADERGFRRAFLNSPDVGGRYSALSLFGLVPASLIGVDLGRLLERARAMAGACTSEQLSGNPGVALGAFMAEAYRQGRDKLCLSCSRGVSSLGLWVEQLVAESTGKEGKGILPVINGHPVLTSDGMHVRVSLTGDVGMEAARTVPAQNITLDDPYDLGAEFFRWCFGTAIASAVLRLNPFNQPNVAESKNNTERVLSSGGVAMVGVAPRGEIDAFLDAIRPGHYVAILAYAAPTASRDERLRALRTCLTERLGVATTIGYGPRYLHSTGQFHKGGPPTGNFIQLVDLPTDHDIEIPGKGYTFGRLVAAQADGDYEALASRGRPVIRINDESVLD